MVVIIISFTPSLNRSTSIIMDPSYNWNSTGTRVFSVNLNIQILEHSTVQSYETGSNGNEEFLHAPNLQI